jgi:hypothetical protein
MFGEVDYFGTESLLMMLTFHEPTQQFRSYVFPSTAPEPIFCSGEFQGDRLVLVSQVVETLFGTQKLRFEFHFKTAGLNVDCDYWTPEGWQRLSRCQLIRHPESI